MVRLLAILALALAVPLQAGAAACAQLCTSAAFGHADAASVSAQVPGDARADLHDAVADDSLPGRHCDKPDASGKCCQGHGAMAHASVHVPSVLIPAFDRAAFAARWSSFIPEEPSPPPIFSARR